MQEAIALAPVVELVLSDEEWIKANLRMRADRPFADVANVLRILERHPDFKGRFRYNDTLGKVLDRGTVMLEWRLNEFTATLQERFLPEIPTDLVWRALVVTANRTTK